MGIQSIVSGQVSKTDNTGVTIKTASKSGDMPKGSSALSGDVLILGFDNDTAYTTYTQKGEYAKSAVVSSASADSSKATSDEVSTTAPTDDEKWKEVTAKYRNKPMTLDNFAAMLDDLVNAGLITSDDSWAAIVTASRRSVHERVQMDLKNGILGDEKYIFNYPLDFLTLLDDLTDKQSKYYNPDLDQNRAAVQKLFTKLSGYFTTSI